MKSISVADDNVPLPYELDLGRIHFGPRHGRDRRQRSCQVGGQLALRPCPTVEIQDDVPEADAIESIQDGVDRRTLLCNEQHPLATGSERRDQVGDGLALPGAWRAVNDKI